MKWLDAIRRIRDGMPVNESTTAMPVDDLKSRTDYLKEVLEA